MIDEQMRRDAKIILKYIPKRYTVAHRLAQRILDHEESKDNQ